jgi:hypothetical protein
MPWGIAAAAVVGAYSANQQSKAAKGAANAQSKGAMAGLEDYKKYNQPYYDAGTSALSRLERLNAGDFSAFTQSPDYQWALDQGNQNILRGASSRGALNSGGTDVDLLRYGQGLATQNYNNYYSKLQNLATMGQETASGIGGQSVGAHNLSGQASGNAAIGSANAWGNYASDLGQLAGQYYGQNRQSTYGRGG